MELRFIGTACDEGDCPTLHDVEGTDEVSVQGGRETIRSTWPSSHCSRIATED
ncbi:hypothetical protein SCANM124S_06137 [Streptomyces canus]